MLIVVDTKSHNIFIQAVVPPTFHRTISHRLGFQSMVTLGGVVDEFKEQQVSQT